MLGKPQFPFPERNHFDFRDGVSDHKAYREKLLARMIKVKTKAKRAAAHQAQHVQLYAFAAVSIPS